MPWGIITREMQTTLTPILQGRTVHDLGAGDCSHARILLACGASRVIAIEKEPLTQVTVPNLTLIASYIANVPLPADLDVVFLGWPMNYPMAGLLPWIQTAKTVIYLGSNFDGTACGFPALFQHLLRRRLLAYVPDRRNNLIVVGEPLPMPREPTLEESAASSSSIVTHYL